LTIAGYARVWIYPKIEYAHRVAWKLAYGEIPEGLHVLHHCDNPPCCNPKHLFIGTPKDNAQDRASKGRGNNVGVKGTDHPLSKLTEDDVKEIKRTYKPGTSGKSSPYSVNGLAKTYGVASSLIHRIIKGISWPHIEERVL